MSQSTSEMPFLEHLQELRSCLARTLCGIALLSVFCFMWATQLFALLTLPLQRAAADGQLQLIGTGPAEAFIVKLKVSLVSGVILSLPYTFFQIWRFISPGLLEHERKLTFPFVLGSTVFFLIGVVFCFDMVLPLAFSFFLSEFESIHTTPTIRIGEYLSFAVKLLIVFGVVFEMPVFSFFLSRVGILSHEFLIKQARYAIVVIFIMAAIITPPDVVTQCLLAGPLVILYGLCIVIAYLVGKKKEKLSG